MRTNIYIITLITIFLSSANLKSQDYKKLYLGEDFSQYEGALFKIDPQTDANFNYCFYDKISSCKDPYNDNVIYPDDKYSFKTVKDSLINRIFRVDTIEIVESNSYVLDEKIPVFVLKDTLMGQIIYFRYDKTSKYKFPFLVANVSLDKNIICSKINKKTDDFTGRTIISSPLFESGKNLPVAIFKSIVDDDVSYFLALQTYSLTVNVYKKGVIILFENGSKLTKKDVEIDVEASQRGYEYSALVPLTKAEAESLATKHIDKFRLYIYDEDVTQGFALKFTNYVKCVLEQR